MTERQTYKILDDFKNSFKKLLPERKEQTELLWLCLKEMFEQIMYYDKTIFPKTSIAFRNKKAHNFDNILAICRTSIKLSKKGDLDNLLSALGHMDAQLFQIQLDAQNARKKVTSIMNKISDKLPDDD